MKKQAFLLSLLALGLITPITSKLVIPQSQTNKSFLISENSNVDSYIASDGSTHNVFWLPGIDAPKMSSDESLLGTPGYFYHTQWEDEMHRKYSVYESPMELSKGYFDLNKDLVSRPDEASHCYLATAGNMLLYWMNYNKDTILQYMNNLESGVYGDAKKLHKVFPYNETRWLNMMKEPALETIGLFKGQQEIGSNMIMDALRPYYDSSLTGYWPDRCIDFFLNGYSRWEHGDSDLENKQSEFKLDAFGGFFYPILGNKRLTSRHTISNYQKASETIKKYLLEGRPLGLSFLTTATSAGAHAITLWGAEYDENDRLTKVFVTDSDDFNNNILAANSNVLRGMHAWDVVEDKNGTAFITTDLDHSKGGSYLSTLYTIDLTSEELKQRVNDTSKAVEPEIVSSPKDVNNALNSPNPQALKVEAKSIDNGYLEYQWYESKTLDGVFSKVKNATSNVLVPSVNALGDTYYYLEITNIKNNFKSVVKSEVIKSSVIDEPLVDAATPTHNFNYRGTTYYDQFETPKKLFVNGHVSDEGTLTYQWYFRTWGDSTATGGNKIEGATNDYLVPFTNNPGTYFYYCILTNTNPHVNGRQVVSISTTYSKRIIVNEAPIEQKDAMKFAKEFIDANICGTDDYTMASSSKFLSFKEKFEALSPEAKNILTNSKAIETSSNLIEKAMAKYDRIISLHGNDISLYPDFISRIGSVNYSGTLPMMSVINNANNYLELIIIVCGVISSFALAAFLILKRKRQR